MRLAPVVMYYGGDPGIFLYNGSELPNRKFLALARQTAT